MATRVKKQPTGLKEVASPQTITTKKDATASGGSAIASKTTGITRKLATKKGIVVKKSSVKKTVHLKAKTKKATFKINPNNFARVLMENGKELGGKKILVKNGGKEVVKRGPRKPKLAKIKKEPTEEGEDSPPVLEPIFPQEENVEEKKSPKKRGRKPMKLPELIDIKIKTESVEEGAGEEAKAVKRTGRSKKPKGGESSSTIDEVISDVLMGGDQIRKEMDDVKKMTKKQRQDLIKKENIENATLTRRLDPVDAAKVIDQLDLNVRKFKPNSSKMKRRHSIEKFPITTVESTAEQIIMPQLSVFNQLPRSISPKTSKRSIKLSGRRSSPYSTRSDSPARMLRNGKSRKLKESNLLDGLENPKRRKRVHSDLSGSETTSKLSGYESDSSFSDMASLHGSEKDSTLKDAEVEGLLMEESCAATATSTSEKPLIDTNSNVCGAKLQEASMEVAVSIKVPEKDLLLDKMKQTFNDLTAPTCEPAKFYNKVPSEAIQTSSAATVQTLLEKSSTEEEELRQLLEQTDPLKDKDCDNVRMENVEEFPIEEKEVEEQASLENIVQSCIDSISSVSPEEAPILEKQIDTTQDDSIPIIDNMSTAILEPPQNHEHLGPPLLESSVPMPTEEEEETDDDHRIGIAVTEKENIVSFRIKHLTDDIEEHETSIEEISSEISQNGKVEEEEEEERVMVEEKEDERECENQKEAESVPETEINEPTPTACEDTSEVPLNSEQPITDSETVAPLIYVAEVAAVEPSQEIAMEPSQEIAVEPSQEIAVEPSQEIAVEPSQEIAVEPCQEIAVEPTVTAEVAVEPSEAIAEENMEPIEPTQVAEIEEEPPHITEVAVTEVVEQPLVMDEKQMTDKQECDNKSSETLIDDNREVEEDISPEELKHKENILNALGLKSRRYLETQMEMQSEAQSKKKSKAGSKAGYAYTGTLKTVIKINKKKGKNSFKMTLHKNKGGKHETDATGETGSWKHHPTKDSSDTAGAHRKSHYSNRSNMDGSSEHTSDGEHNSNSPDKNQPEKSLIVPEKASSFSIHPGRLCKDECSYCFGKFGLFDTPCHIAQMKNVERQDKILAAEKHLTRDSCLCDACYRHVDRKSNSPSYINKSLKRNSLVAPGPRQNHCYVLGCDNVSTNILRRKWIIKMRKSICQVINIDLDNPGLHSIPICDEHFSALEHLMICAMCKRRLARNHIHYLGPEVAELNEALKDEGIPISLSDKPVVCKLCKCFASIILKDPEERMENSVNFFMEYKKRLLHFNDIVPMDSTSADEPIVAPNKGDKREGETVKKKKHVRHSSNEEKEVDSDARPRKRAASSDQSHSESQEEGDEYGGVDYNTLIPAIAMECPSDGEATKDKGAAPKKMPRLESLGNAIEISRTFKSGTDRNRSNDLAAQKLVQNPSISLKPNYGSLNESWQQHQSSSRLMSNPALSVRQLFPGEEELGLAGDIDFKTVTARTPEGWEKCTATIQYDEETKMLWQELQKPYGSKSSFLRHLVLLEKYFRNGDLVLSSTASHHAVNYRESVQNRLRAYDNIPTNAGQVQPSVMVKFNKMHEKTFTQANPNGLPPVTISQIDKQSKTPITLQQLSQPPLFASQSFTGKSKPPGLISIGGGRPSPVTLIRPQMPGQKIKFPITKNWRPTLIPIDPSKKQERKAGLVQVISGGRPYHITLEDYKKMCAIKRSFEAKQKKIQEQQQQLFKQKQQQPIVVSHNSVLRTVVPKRGLIISKTSGGTVTETKPISLVPLAGSSDCSETILEKLDKQVEQLGKYRDGASITAIALEKNPAIQIIPRIPKSLTVIPQTVTKGTSNGSTSDGQP